MKHRQNKTHEQISRVQIFEAGEDVQLGESFRHLQIAKRDYAYRCFKSTNGREQEVDCGTNFSFSGVNIPSLLQQANSYYQEEGDIRYFCLESDSTGNWQKVECGAIPKIPVNTFVEEKEVTVQIFPGGENMVKQLESGKYHQQQIGGQSFIYRCFRKTGGREQEVDCSNRLSLSKVDVSKFLEQAGQQEGQIRYTCLEPDSGGNLRSVQCDNVPKIKFKTEIVRYSWGSNDTHYWNDSGVYRTAQGQDFKTIQVFPGGEEVRRQLQGQGFQYQQINGKDYVYRCFRRIDGRQEEIDCGENFSFSSVDIPWLLERANVQQDGQIRYTCLEPDEKGNLRSGNCGSVPKIQFKSEIKKYFWGSNDTHYWNNTGVYRTGQRRHFTTVQVFPGGEEVRRQLQGQGYHYQQINGKEYVYRCFRRIDGRQEEIDCGDNFSFSSVNIPWLLERANVQQDGHIRYTCLEPDEEGNLRSGNCGSVPKIQFKTEVRKYFWGSNDTHYWNNTGVYRTSRREGVTVQIFPGSESLRRLLEGRGYHYREINGREYIYRCFRRTGGREEEVDCGDSFSFSTVNIPLLLERTGVHQDGNIRYTCLETDLAGNLMTRDCVGVPKIHFKTDVTFWQSNGTHYWNSTGVYRTSTQYDFSIVQIFESGEDTTHFIGRYRFETINNRNYFYRCFKNRQQVDCGASFSLAGINLVELLRRVAIRYEGRIQYFCLDMDSTGNWRNADCSGLPKIELAGQRPPVQPDILQRCLTLVDNKWQEVDCASEVRFQTDRTFVRECFQTVNGQRTRIDCDNVPQGALTGGSRYQGGTQSNVNYNPAYGGGYGYNNQSYIYDESEYVDENEDTYANPEPGLTPRDPKTYGTYDRSRQGSVDGLGGAAQGKGFTTVALDLGNLNPNLGGNYHGAGESHWSETRQVPPVYNNIERDNVPTAAPTSKNWHHGRRKRQIIGDTHPSIGDIRKEFPCTNLACVYMRCTIENLEYNKPLTIALRGRLNAKVLREMKLDNAMEFSSMMVARVHKVPHLMSLEDSQFVSQEVKTVVKTPEEIKSETVPLWVVVLSAVAGTIILLLIIFLMYKFGFFRRNRPYSAPERQPLRNGYPADEAL